MNYIVKKRKIPELVEQLPEDPKKNALYDKIIHNKKIGDRRVTFKATGEKGFGKWKIIKNIPA